LEDTPNPQGREFKFPTITDNNMEDERNCEEEATLATWTFRPCSDTCEEP